MRSNEIYDSIIAEYLSSSLLHTLPRFPRDGSNARETSNYILDLPKDGGRGLQLSMLRTSIGTLPMRARDLFRIDGLVRLQVYGAEASLQHKALRGGAPEMGADAGWTAGASGSTNLLLGPT